VVIAIIAVLAALLLPALETARDRARVTSCLGSLRQISLGLSMYTDDYSGWFPHRDYYKADPHQWTMANESCCNYGNGDPPGDPAGPHPWDYEAIEPYITPGPLYVCPFKGGDWQDSWPKRFASAKVQYYWQGYYCFVGHAAHDITRHPVRPDGTYMSPPRTPEAENRRQWRLAVPHRINENTRCPVAGDQLILWRENHFTTPAGYHGCFTGSHIRGTTEFLCGTFPTNPITSFTVPPHNFTYSDGSARTVTTDLSIVIAYLGYTRSTYWQLK